MTLDALLKEVEALYARPIAVCHGPDSVTDDGITALFTMHHRAMLLARMLRVAVGALRVAVDDLDPECPSFARAARNRVFAALSRLDAMAGEVGA